MKKLFLPAPILIALTHPAGADKLGMFLDGMSTMTNYTDPYNEPPMDNAREGLVSFRFSSTGQMSEGEVQIRQVMFPGNQYDGPIQLTLLPTGDQNYDGAHCPFLYWDIVNQAGDGPNGTLSDAQQQDYSDEQCAIRPDQRLFESGSKVGIKLTIKDGEGGWLVALWAGVVGNLAQSGGAVPGFDGGQYNVQAYWFTGDLTYPPTAKLIVSERNLLLGVMTDPDYVDASYNYISPSNGFDVPWAGKFWQIGTYSTDVRYMMYWAFTGSIGEYWEMYGTHDNDVFFLPSIAGRFINPQDNSAADIGNFGQVPIGIPPVAYHTGGAASFIVNQADVGYGENPPQTYISQGWTMIDFYNNPNFYNRSGAGIVDGIGF